MVLGLVADKKWFIYFCLIVLLLGNIYLGQKYFSSINDAKNILIEENIKKKTEVIIHLNINNNNLKFNLIIINKIDSIGSFYYNLNNFEYKIDGEDVSLIKIAKEFNWARILNNRITLPRYVSDTNLVVDLNEMKCIGYDQDRKIFYGDVKFILTEE